MKNKLVFAVVFLIMALGATLRTYKLHEPLGDWHSWRQVDTASVASEYVKRGEIDLLSPRYHDVSSIPSGLDNPEGFRYVEFPLRDALHAWLVMLFPSVGLVEWGRIISIVASVLTIGLIFLVANHVTGTTAGLFSALIYAILPYNIFYGRVILPEPSLVLFMVASLYCYLRAWDTRSMRWYLGALFTLAIAVLFKPTALVIVLPMIGYSLPNFFRQWRMTLLAMLLPILALIPYYFWRKYLSAYPAGIPANSWLFNSNNIRFKGAWFHWLFGQRLGKLILGYFGMIPFGLGIAKLGLDKKETLVYGGLLLGSLSYLAIIATGNVQHDYYQIQIMPTIAIFTGLGLSELLKAKNTIQRLVRYILVFSIILLSVSLAWYEVRGFFWINNRAMVLAGQHIDQLVPRDALVIAPYMGDTAFLFQTNRRGWPIGGAIEDKIKAGATYYVTTSKDAEFKALLSSYELLVDLPEYAIIKLVK